MNNRKAGFLIPLIISSPKESEILHKAISLGLVSKYELEPGFIYKKNVFCLREFFFEGNSGFLKEDVFIAKMEYVGAVCRPVWDCLWEQQDPAMESWEDFNLVFRETFQDKDLVTYILVFFYQDGKWKCKFEELEKYEFSEKDRAVCFF